MNSLLTPEMSDNRVEALANSPLLAANFALFLNISGISCFVQIQSALPWGSADRIVNSLLTPEMSDNCVEALANSSLLAANFALFSTVSGIICFVQIQSALP